MGGRSAYEAALNLLARRDHSAAELTRKLSLRGYAPDEIESAVSRLQELSYLDDRRYAGQWASRAVQEGTAVGPRLRLELRRRGIAPDIVDAVVTEAGADLDEQRAIADLLARRFARFDPAGATPQETRRVVSWLQRRGFSLAAIFATLRAGSSDRHLHDV